jgi:GINS complex subunit 2
MFEQAEYFAENSSIDIIPSRNIAALKLLSGTLGPFKLLQRTTVPIWVAVVMKQKHLCKIIPPSWMTVESLESILERESKSQEFQAFDFYFLEVCFIILKVCEDIPDRNRLMILISDIRQKRGKVEIISDAKIRIGFKSLDGSYLQTNNFGSVEIESIREFYCAAFNKLRDLS